MSPVCWCGLATALPSTSPRMSEELIPTRMVEGGGEEGGRGGREGERGIWREGGKERGREQERKRKREREHSNDGNLDSKMVTIYIYQAN